MRNFVIYLALWDIIPSSTGPGTLQFSVRDISKKNKKLKIQIKYVLKSEYTE